MNARLHCLLATVLVLLAACGSDRDKASEPEASAPPDKVLHVYNWADYIGESTLADFEAKTGIKVTYDTYDSNEILETKMLTGKSGYDVVVPSTVFLRRQVRAGAFQKLDKSKLPNLVHMDSEIMRMITAYDPGNEHAINYVWGTTGIGYNPALVEKALGTRTIESWAAVFDPAVAAKLAKCGIAMLDAPSDIIGLVRIYLGLDLNSVSLQDLAAAEAALMQVRPYVRYFDSSRFISDLASGEICVAVGWSGHVLQARKRGAEAQSPVEVAYAIPQEGAPIWFDMAAIPVDAPNPDNAHAFLDFLMNPEVMAGVSNTIEYANGNAGSRPFIKESLRNDRSVYPPAEVMKTLVPYAETVSPEYDRALNRAWTRVKTGS